MERKKERSGRKEKQPSRTDAGCRIKVCQQISWRRERQARDKGETARDGEETGERRKEDTARDGDVTEDRDKRGNGRKERDKIER